ncbi:MAG: hypothetical protein DME15_08705, partial [Candidatus Rokuibacteriota bacterium]
MATLVSSEDKPESRSRQRRKKGGDRWLAEVKGILCLVAAGFLLLALALFRPDVPPAEQASPVGPVGVWLAWVSFQSFGYASFFFPLLLGAWGTSAFVRPLVARGFIPVAGLGILLAAAAGLLGHGAAKGGIVGEALATGLRGGVGNFGAWLVLLAAVPVGVLCVTRVSYAVLARVLKARLAQLRRDDSARADGSRLGSRSSAQATALAGESSALDVFTPPVVVEPSRPRGRLAEQGLAWQETFDFGKGGAKSFQLPPVGLLKAPPASELKRTREELQENAETLRKRLQEFEVDGRIVQVSPGPIITSYEFEPAPGVKVSQVVNLGDDLALALKSASVRIVGPIPGRGTVAIEVPDDEASMVYLREIFVSAEFAESQG